MFNLFNIMMELCKCCNYLYFINGVEEKILIEFCEVCYIIFYDFYLQVMVCLVGKLVFIDKLFLKFKVGGYKVLIFFQMVCCLDILEDYLIQRRYLYECIDG